MTTKGLQALGPRQGPSPKYQEIIEWVTDPKRERGDNRVFSEHDDYRESKDVQRALYAALLKHAPHERMKRGTDWKTMRQTGIEKGKHRFYVVVLICSQLAPGFVRGGTRHLETA